MAISVSDGDALASLLAAAQQVVKGSSIDGVEVRHRAGMFMVRFWCGDTSVQHGFTRNHLRQLRAFDELVDVLRMRAQDLAG